MNKNPDTSRSTVLFEKHEMLLDVIKMFNTNNNENDIIKSINEKILPLEDKIEIFQGHGETISMKEIRNVLNLTK